MLLSKMSKFFNYLLCIPNTLFFNFYYLPFRQAIRFPIIVSHRVKFVALGGNIILPEYVKSGKIKLGFGRVQVADNKYSRLIWSLHDGGSVRFGHNIKIGTGCRLFVNGSLTIGDKCNFSGESSIICHDSVTFGKRCLISWQTLFMDTDLHQVIDLERGVVNSNAAIVIGDDVWVCARATLLKGVSVGSNSVVSSNANVVTSCIGNSVLGGNPAKVIGSMEGKAFKH